MPYSGFGSASGGGTSPETGKSIVAKLQGINDPNDYLSAKYLKDLPTGTVVEKSKFNKGQTNSINPEFEVYSCTNSKINQSYTDFILRVKGRNTTETMRVVASSNVGSNVGKDYYIEVNDKVTMTEDGNTVVSGLRLIKDDNSVRVLITVNSSYELDGVLVEMSGTSQDEENYGSFNLWTGSGEETLHAVDMSSWIDNNIKDYVNGDIVANGVRLANSINTMWNDLDKRAVTSLNGNKGDVTVSIDSLDGYSKSELDSKFKAVENKVGGQLHRTTPMVSTPLVSSLSIKDDEDKILFTRSSEMGFYNKSNVLQTFGVDKPIFNVDGLVVNSATTNYCLHSSPQTTGSNANRLPDTITHGCSVKAYSKGGFEFTVSSSNDNSHWCAIPVSDDGSIINEKGENVYPKDAKKITCSFKVVGSLGSEKYIEKAKIEGRLKSSALWTSMAELNVSELKNAVRYAFSADIPNGNAGAYDDISLVLYFKNDTPAEEHPVIDQVQIEFDATSADIWCNTGSTVKSTSSSIVAMSAYGKLDLGDEWTMVLDYAIPELAGNQTLLFYEKDGVRFKLMIQNGTLRVQYGVPNDMITKSLTPFEKIVRKGRMVLTHNDTGIALFINGKKYRQQRFKDLPDYIFDEHSTIYFGKQFVPTNRSNPLVGTASEETPLYLKDFRFYQKVLTDAEIISWGKNED